MEKTCLGRGDIHLPEVPWARQLFVHFRAKLGEALHKKQEVGSARRAARL